MHGSGFVDRVPAIHERSGADPRLLKIDRSFVRGMLAKPSAAGNVQAIVHPVDSLGLCLVAAGPMHRSQFTAAVRAS